ncbi:hypothetical protein R5R35_012387 [Gryllus longicercus]|uniref:CBM21 domain-containing protein n=2 Tax=Gryllus longicercus TaxID=2509291 RepID=A0AAN9YXL4_9ORTH
MCSLAAMPADYEMLVSHSPPAFSHSPPLSAGFLADYSPAAAVPSGCGFHRLPSQQQQPHRLSLPPRPRAPPPPAPAARLAAAPAPAMPVAAPRRPCLVVRPEEAAAAAAQNGSGDDFHAANGDLPSPTRLKKKVVFADDKGLALTQVRVMSEPSNVPPMWTLQFLAQVTKGASAEVAPEPWEVTFPQPASDYLDFRHRLDTANVSLENVIVRESEEAVVGTVKVRNLCFQKEVLVRASSDGWATQEDAFCTYVNNNNNNNNSAAVTAAAAGYAIYDTFSFRLTLPPRSRRIEFCVCFRCEDGAEFWDNNAGKNYVLVKKTLADAPAHAGAATPAAAGVGRPDAKTAGKFNDALYAKVDSWSEFASWNHLVNDTPYW